MRIVDLTEGLVTQTKHYDKYTEITHFEKGKIIETKKICKTCNKEYFNKGECSKELTCEDIKLLYNNGEMLQKIIICKQCNKPSLIAKSKYFCSIKCYDKYRYINNINGRREKLNTIAKLRKNRLQYIKKLSAQQLLNEVLEDGI